MEELIGLLWYDTLHSASSVMFFWEFCLKTLYVSVSTKYKPRTKYPLISGITQAAHRVLTEKELCRLNS